MDPFSFLSNTEILSVEEMYQQYQENPESLDTSWRNFFKGFEFAQSQYALKPGHTSGDTVQRESIEKEFKVIDLIRAYRQRGHFFTETNPVRQRRKYTPTLAIENFGLSKDDLNTDFEAATEIGLEKTSLNKIIEHLEQTYCRSIGVEYVFIRKPEIVEWLQEKMERVRNTPRFSVAEKKHFFYHLKVAVGFENFIHRKYVGQKRFSLEGAETMIPALDSVIETGANLGIKEFIIGMPHRGRLNVLANIMKKPYENIFHEFVAKQYDETTLLGDVKYHLGYDNTITTDSGKEVRLNLAPNPSHLEAVNPVVAGIARGKAYKNYDKDFSKVAPILIHGDAAIAGQGIVYEVVQMSQLKGYRNGGTIHLVINNQVGFTTNYLDARSSTYSTDVAKVTRSPVFHVNGDDVEALVYTINLAMEFRQRFQSDVFIDLLCYRKYGHNEGDEPRFTQPLLYKSINKHPNPRDIYAQKLVNEGIYSQDEIKTLESDFTEFLEEKLAKSREMKDVHIDKFLSPIWKNYRHSRPEDFEKSPETAVEQTRLKELANKMNTLPEDKKFFKKVYRIVEERKKMVEENRLDWAMGELLAYATLLDEGYSVRLSGQDSERGTFAHRHASFVYLDSDEKYFPLKHLSDKQGQVHIFNSPLNEYGVMGFEYGHALTRPDALTIWEAQFGDFNNVGQAIIDQYISSAEDKWGIMNGLVLLLPHGYEGQGPEHSSARIERFLNLCGDWNMQVANPTTPANFFHLLRRQIHREFRLPLVVFAPKSLLRHAEVKSSLDELAQGRFHEVLDDNQVQPDQVERVVLCSGKIYYDLLEKQREHQVTDTAVVRLEQLYPFPKQAIDQVLSRYKGHKELLWAQEEPENMGPWRYICDKFGSDRITPVTRPEASTPAPGLLTIDRELQRQVVQKSLNVTD